LRAFKNRVLRRILEPKRNEVTGGWRKRHNEKLYILYSSPNIIRMVISKGIKNAYRILVEMPEGKRPLGRPGRNWGNNIEMDLREEDLECAGHSGRAVWSVGSYRSDAGIVGSNPAQGMDVCPHLSVLCCPV
jgi:hypothetical protein